eukprot:1710893-Alexandrium_andersonii.AAC.1
MPAAPPEALPAPAVEAEKSHVGFATAAEPQCAAPPSLARPAHDSQPTLPGMIDELTQGSSQ